MTSEENLKQIKQIRAIEQRSSNPVYRPIIFVGAPRSGTTIIFEAFSAHEDLAWFSNYLHRFPRIPAVSLLSRLGLSNSLLGAKRQNGESAFRIPKPYAVECYPAWETCCGHKFSFDFLIDAKCSEVERDKTIDLVSRVTKYQGKVRFATKITGPSRMVYLSSIFPDALFIHVIRDGRAVANSLLKVEFWKQGGGYDKPWWSGGLTDEDYETYCRYDKSPLVLAAIQWRRIILVAREEAAQIGPDRYMEIRYEDALRDPVLTMGNLIRFSQLKDSRKVYDYIEGKSELRDMNFKFANDLSSEKLSVLNEVLGDVNTELGYI